MQTLISNYGDSILLTDANWFNTGDRCYWWDRTGTLFGGDNLFKNAKTKSTNPIGFGYLNQAITDRTIAERINNEWYWFIGDVVHGGLAFVYKDVNSFYVTFIKLFLNNEGQPDHYEYQAITIGKTQNFYIIDKMYVAGDEENYGSCLFVSDNDGKFLLGYYQVIPPIPPVVVWTVSAVEQYLVKTLPTGNTMPPSVPTSLRAFQGTNNGYTFNPEGETVFSITYEAWTHPLSRAYFDCWDNLDNSNLGMPDPNDQDGYSTTGGGDGTPQSSVDIDFPSLPPDMLLNSGAIKMYVPSAEDMQSFMHYIYSSPTDIINNFKKIWANPMESIISFAVAPVDLSTFVNGTEEVSFCGVDTGVYMPKISSQFKEIDCGPLEVVGEYQSLLDYNSYTKVSLFLPFIGVVPLEVDEIMDATLTLKYFCDLLTGECMAILKSSKTWQDDSMNIQYNSCLYEFKGNMLTEAPLTGNNFQQLYSGVINLAQAVALPIATGASAMETAINAGASLSQGVLGQKVAVQRSGVISGNVGTLGEYIPYIIVEKPIRSIPSNNEIMNGYPANFGATIKDYIGTGYTVCKAGTVRTEDIARATHEEKEKIREILETGVYL